MENLQICDRLRNLRKKAKLSKEDIGEICDVHPTTYYRWEKGEAKIPLDASILLARHYGLSVSELIGENSESKDKAIGIKEIFSILTKHSSIIELMTQIPADDKFFDNIEGLLRVHVRKLEEKESSKEIG